MAILLETGPKSPYIDPHHKELGIIYPDSPAEKELCRILAEETRQKKDQILESIK